MTMTLPLIICLACLLIPTAAISQQPLSESTREQKKDFRSVDALWINILPSRIEFSAGKHPQVSYFDLQSDGRFIFAAGDEFSAMKVLRSGVLPQKLVQRAFRIVDKPSILNATDTEPGEPIHSDSDWISVGLMTAGGKVKAKGGWGYREELKDFPAEFRELIGELKSAAARLPQATNIKALLSAAVVDAWRIDLIGRDQFIALDEASLDRLPALKQAISMSRRMVVVEDKTQLTRLAELARRMNPQSTYWGLYKIGKEYYEISTPYLQH